MIRKSLSGLDPGVEPISRLREAASAGEGRSDKIVLKQRFYVCNV